MREQGFTLIELLVVIAIMGVLITIVTLDFGRYLRKANSDAEVKQLYADLQDARAKAAFTKRKHRVEFSAQQVIIRRFDSDADLVGTPISTKKLPIAITTNWASPNVIDFDTKGIMSDPTNIKVICVSTPEDAAYDALIVAPVTTSMGKVINRGASCAITNVVQK